MKNKRKKTIVDSMFGAAFVTTMFMELATACSGVIDGIIISKLLGADAMAAQGIVQPFFTVLMIFSGTLAVGMQTYCMPVLARGNTRDSQKAFSVAVTIGLLLSAVIGALIFIFPKTLGVFLGARGNAAELLPQTADYIKGIAWGVIPMILTPVIASALQMDSHGNLVVKASVTLLVINSVLDVTFFKFGMGMYGMGLATTISNYVNLLVLLLHFLRKEKIFHLSTKNIGWEKIGNISVLGARKAIVNLAYAAALIILNTIMIKFGGTHGMTALSVQNNLAGVLLTPNLGVANAVSLLIGVSYGEKNELECKDIGRKAHLYTGIYGVGITILLSIFAKPISLFYDATNGPVAELLRFGLVVLGVNMLMDCLVLARSTYLQTTRQLVKSNLVCIFNYCVAPCLAALVLGNLFGSRGVLAAFAVANIIAYIVMYIYVAVEAKKPIPKVDDYMRLPDDFRLKPYDVIELNIENEDQAVTVAEQVQLFCKGHKIDKNKGYKAALCLEEITTNVFRHGYKKQKKQALPIDIRLTISNGDIIMKIRDNCKRFDLSERIKAIQDNENAEKNIGMKIIAKTAKDIKYVNLMDTNTLIVTI